VPVVICSNCGTENEGNRFCTECGHTLVAACPVCATVNAPAAKFCGNCGTSLEHASQAGAPAGNPVPTPAGVAERRLVSVLFNDLVGFTSLSEGRDAEETRELLSHYFDAAREIVERYGGTIEKFIGDAVMAVWGTPTAHEDDAERAVRAALDLVAAVARMEVAGQPLQARAGVLTGEAAVSIGAQAQGMVAGDMVNTASRLQSVAPPGSVLVGEATHRATSDAIAYEEAGEQQLKGKQAPVPAWRAISVVARRGGEGRAAGLEPPFVGRDDELSLLKDLFHATAREQKPRLVTAVGQAGIGKSRLAWEFEKYLDGVVETAFWHEGRSPAYGEGISYWALAEMIRGRAGIAEGDDPATARDKVSQMVVQYVPDEVEQRGVEPRLAGLLGLEALPAEGREQLFTAWRTFFERMAQQQTVILVFWDLQWADQGLLDFIEYLLAWARTSPIFVIAEARPELLDRRPEWGRNARSATTINLEPLTDAEMGNLLRGLVPGLPEQASLAIIGRAEGIPLYAVETLRMLIDRGALQPDGDRYRLATQLPELIVPETLHALIAARLDALDAEARSVVTSASVLGLSFTLEALEAVVSLAGSVLRECLERLSRLQLLMLDVDLLSPERGQHKFVQALVREVAYQSLSKRDRRAKHVAAARYFESLGEDELSGVLATHYLDAYNATPPGPEADALAAQARVALRAAAERAASLHSQRAALAYLDQALTVTSDPKEQAALHERAATAAWVAGRQSEALSHARAAEAIHTEAGDRIGILRARTIQATAHLASHGDRPAIALLRQALDDVSDLEPTRETAEAQAQLARALMLAGSPESMEWADRVLSSRQVADEGLIVETLITKGSALMSAGAWLESEVTLRGAMEVADRLSDLSASLRSRNNLRVTVEWTSIDAALQLDREGYDLARRYGLSTWLVLNIGAALFDSLEIGAWDDWFDEVRAEVNDASVWYKGWFRLEEAWRLAYRGEIGTAERALQENLAGEEIQNSAQAMAANSLLAAHIHMASGRWREAFDVAKAAWSDIDAMRNPMGQLAAVAAGDRGRLEEARASVTSRGAADPPFLRAIQDVGDALAAVLDERWDEARAAYLSAVAQLELATGWHTLARLQLAIGHAAAGRFPEAAEAAAAAETFFNERGAASYVRTYREKAWRPAEGQLEDRRVETRSTASSNLPAGRSG
jgi:class 3 adenylate cyclase